MRKICVFLIAAVMINTLCFAQPLCSPWAKEYITEAAECGIITCEPADYTIPVTRGEIAMMIANAYGNISEKTIKPGKSPFDDADDKYITAVYELGIMNGTGGGKFSPDSCTTRQEIAKIMLEFKAVAEGKTLTLPEKYDCGFTDFDEVSEWAKPYVAVASAQKLINGYDDGSFKAKDTVSREQTVAIIMRSAEFNKKPKQKLEGKCEIGENAVMITWEKVRGEDTYTVKVTEKRLSYYEGDIPPADAVEYELTDEYSKEIRINPNRKYKVEINAGDYYFAEDIYVPPAECEMAEEILQTFPQTKEEAEALMTVVTVPVWKLCGDEKVAAETEITVHSAIAEKVKLVFEEIFGGEEKFPIKDIGGFSWRGGKSEHNAGTAIDINANENYCIYTNGTTVGEFWKPYENPYSVTPYGDVVKAFEKYGFTWGGDAWPTQKDYMHFSYLGT